MSLRMDLQAPLNSRSSGPDDQIHLPDSMEDQIAFYSNLNTLPTPPASGSQESASSPDSTDSLSHPDTFRDLQAKLSLIEDQDYDNDNDDDNDNNNAIENNNNNHNENEINLNLTPSNDANNIMIYAQSDAGDLRDAGRSVSPLNTSSRPGLSSVVSSQSLPLADSSFHRTPSVLSSVNWSQITTIDLTPHASTAIDMLRSEFLPEAKNLPAWLSVCEKLQYLIIPGLGLRTVDEWVSVRLTQLRVLDVSDNAITIWPDHLVRLLRTGNLSVLNLDGNPCVNALRERSPNYKSQAEYILAKSADTDYDSDYENDHNPSQKQNQSHSPPHFYAPIEEKSDPDETASLGSTHKKTSGGLLSLFKSKPKFKNNNQNYSHNSPTSDFGRVGRRSRANSLSLETPPAHCQSISDRSSSVVSVGSGTYSLGGSYSNNKVPSLFSHDNNGIPDSMDPFSLHPTREEGNFKSNFEVGNDIDADVNTDDSSLFAEGPPDASLAIYKSMEANYRILPVDIAKSQIYFHLLRDIWEIATQETLFSPLAIKFDQPHLPSSSIWKSHKVSPKLKIEEFISGNLQHSRIWALTGTKIGLVVTPSRAPIPSDTRVGQLIDELLQLERQYIKHLEEMISVFVDVKTNPRFKHIMYVFDPYSDILKFHKDFMVDLMKFSSEIYRSGQDVSLNRLGDAITKAYSKLDRLYKKVGYVITTATTLVRFWQYQAMGCISASPYGGYYGGENFHVAYTKLLSLGLSRSTLDTLGFVANNFKQQDFIALGSWYRGASKSKRLTLDSLQDYLKLPLQHLINSLCVFHQLRSLGPGISISSELLGRMSDEVGTILVDKDARLKLSQLQRRYSMNNANNAQSEFYKDDKAYMTDFIVSVFDKTHLSPKSATNLSHYECDAMIKRRQPITSNQDTTSIKDGLGFSLLDSTNILSDLSAHDISVSQTPCITNKSLYPASCITNVYRIIVLTDYVIVCDEHDLKIIKQVSRSDVICTLPTPFQYAEANRGRPEPDPHPVWTFPYSPDNGLAASQDKLTKSSRKPTRKSRKARKQVLANLKEDHSLRILFLDSMECWHATVEKHEVVQSTSVVITDEVLTNIVKTINLDTANTPNF
ncbi:hypothetical protein NADFUDRAFT_45071 [Nadsonia fulvescens var. elongata DSM 6958]|uniref:DH domain-containing protein n=1 Tax=Nadsonia fulvescens var. elongata DSM 6958 TaxID=857566 RepID=A0A1E3PSX9_9ASCO|nr:hypothetical protein NADFUDRAFT_45071 [Nadsonia fulvescens var. elongata DSM 6958]